MGKRHDKFRRMLYFLEESEHQQRRFSLEELAEATGYKLSSLRTYYGKRLKNVLVTEHSDGTYQAHGLSVFNEQSFIDYMTQRSSPPSSVEGISSDDDDDEDDDDEQDEGPPEAIAEDLVVEGILTRAQDAMRAALELMHQPHRGHRLTLFALLALEAWGMLLKGELARTRGLEQLYDPMTSLKPLGLKELLPRVYPHNADPVRRNLEWVELLGREHAELLVPECAPYLMRLYQATALNFRKRFEALAGRRFLPQSAGLMLLVNDEEVVSIEALRQRYGDMFATRQESLFHELRFEELELASRAFMTEPGFAGALLHPQLGDSLVLSGGKAPVEALRQLELEQSGRAYPFDATQASQEINRLLPFDRRLHANAIDIIDVVFGVRMGSPNRYYQRVDIPPYHLYSRAYVHWVARAIRQDPQWLRRAQEAVSPGALRGLGPNQR